VIVLADSSPSSHSHQPDISNNCTKFYGEVMVSREVHDEVTVAGTELPAAEEVWKATWIRVLWESA